MHVRVREYACSRRLVGRFPCGRDCGPEEGVHPHVLALEARLADVAAARPRAGAQTFGVKFFDCRGALRISFIVQLSKIDAPKGWGGPRLGCPRRRWPHAPSPIGCKRAVESTLYAPRRPRNVVFVQCLQCSKEFSPFLAFCKKSVSSTRSSASSGCGDVHRRRARRHSRDGSAPSPPRRGFPATSRAVGRSATATMSASCSPPHFAVLHALK